MTDEKILDNSGNRTVVNYLKKIINKNNDSNIKSKLDIVSAYFTIHAFDDLKDELLNKVSQVRFILGEPSSVEKLEKKDKRLKHFKIEDENIKLDNVIQQNKMAKECYNWLSKKNVEIKTAPKKDNHKALIHGKMYYIEPEIEIGTPHAVVGSSNFTSSGLGINPNSNYELNTVVDNDTARSDLKKWFNNLWENNTEDAKKEILGYLKSIYKENSPEEVYYKTLYHLLKENYQEEDIEDVSKSEKFTKTKIWNMLYDFQKDAVNSIIKRLKKYNGCILADSVGLGKTFTALGVIQYFITHYRKPKVLVVAPKRLKGNWEIYKSNGAKNIFDEDGLHVTFVTHSGLISDKLEDDINIGNFDLVVIDESHNFRNATPSKKDKDGNIEKISRYDKLLNKILKDGVRSPKVLLLSATPVNTKLSTDLNNQIRLITFDNDEAFAKSLGVPHILQTLKDANKEYNNWAIEDNRQVNDLLSRFSPNFYKLLDALTIARSRKQIVSYYSNSEDQIGKFPKRENPKSIRKGIDTEKNPEKKFPTFKEIDKKIDEYSLALFKPATYLNEESKKEEKLAGNMTQVQREDYLIGMMKAGFLKRLESSIFSFTKSMENTLNKIDERIKLINEYKLNRENTTITSDFEEISNEINDDEDIINDFNKNDEEYSVGKKLQYSLKDLKIDDWKKDLEEDYKKIKEIYDIAKEVTPDRDEKLTELKTIIRNKSKEPNKKILLFTTFADTANYLYDELCEYVKDELKLNIAVVTGGANRTTLGSAAYDDILENFSPCSKLNLKPEEAPKEQIDIIIATDCISEGQNLQDCDTVINYDIHWNPVRLIQRFGRIDRIGSTNNSIKMINFWPTEDLDEYINLKNRVESRMMIVDATAAADDNLLEENKAAKKDLTYRDEQLKRIMNEESIDGIEDSNNMVNMSNFSLDDFRKELNDFLESKKKDLEDTPNGINAIVPNTLENGKTVPGGVIFCLKQKIIEDKDDKNKNEEKHKENKVRNELFPYYLIYIKNDGTVLYNYGLPREILDKYKSLCLGKKEPFMELCEKFNTQTQTEEGMEFYNKILKSAIEQITERYNKTMIPTGRDGGIPTDDEQIKNEDDLELITWLIIDGE